MTGRTADGSTTRVHRYLVAPARRFLATEAAAGVLVLAGAVVALVWVNLGSSASYHDVWEVGVDIEGLGRLGTMTLHDFVNDAAMTLFFFVVGLEIKFEWFQGHLVDRRFARLPVVAALGGMLVPALCYVAITSGTAGSHGWGIAMATDIAFVVGVMAVLGSRVPAPIRVFLLTLAIVDDLGAIVVIAVFYAGGLEWFWLAAAVAGLGVAVALRRVGVQWIPVYAVVGAGVWYATWQSGVHATIAGVALAFCTPLQARRRDGVWSPVGVLVERLHPLTGFVIVPLFALANAGVVVAVPDVPDAGRVALGVVVGLVVGKTVGIAGASWLMVRLGAASLPDGAGWRHLGGAAMLAGIGFTMSLFITDLAFTGPGATGLADAAKIGILAASAVAAILGATVFVVGGRSGRSQEWDGAGGAPATSKATSSS